MEAHLASKFAFPTAAEILKRPPQRLRLLACPSAGTNSTTSLASGPILVSTALLGLTEHADAYPQFSSLHLSDEGGGDVLQEYLVQLLVMLIQAAKTSLSSLDVSRTRFAVTKHLLSRPSSEEEILEGFPDEHSGPGPSFIQAKGSASGMIAWI